MLTTRIHLQLDYEWSAEVPSEKKGPICKLNRDLRSVVSSRNRIRVGTQNNCEARGVDKEGDNPESNRTKNSQYRLQLALCSYKIRSDIPQIR
jgi:hypothetical protein